MACTLAAASESTAPGQRTAQQKWLEEQEQLSERDVDQRGSVAAGALAVEEKRRPKPGVATVAASPPNSTSTDSTEALHRPPPMSLPSKHVEELDDVGDVLKQSFRFDLDDLSGEVVRLQWGQASSLAVPSVALAPSFSGTKERGKPRESSEAPPSAGAALVAKASTSATLMHYGENLSQALHIVSYVENKDNSKLPSPLRRLLQLDGSPFVTPLPPSVSDPVGRDLKDLPNVLAKIQSEWDNPTDSLNRMSAWTFTHLLRKRMKAHDDDTHDGSVDLLISGCEVSLWVGEQFATDLHRVFPKLKIVTLSSNKLLGQLGQSFPVAQTNFAFHAESHNFNNSLCLLVSHSGGTFATLACANLLRSFTSHIFCVTSEWDTQVARAIRNNNARSNQGGLTTRSFIFITHCGLRPAEPCTISVVATHQLLTQILLYIMYYLRHFDVRAPLFLSVLIRCHTSPKPYAALPPNCWLTGGRRVCEYMRLIVRA